MKKFLIIFIVVFILTLSMPFASIISDNSGVKKENDEKNDREIVTIFNNN